MWIPVKTSMKILDDIVAKVAQIMNNILGYFEKPHSYVKTY